MTLALGLASVWMINGFLKGLKEVPVNLPEIKSESPIIIFPREERFIPSCDGSVGKKEENNKYCIIVVTKS